MQFSNSLLNLEQRKQLLCLAKESVRFGLEHGHAKPVIPNLYPEVFRQELASFVTIKIDDRLRGCIGHLKASQPLVSDVVENAWSAASKDSRFPKVSQLEFPKLTFHISVLTTPEPIIFKSEKDLLSQITPGIDGLILEAPYARGTFLPSVWDQLPKVEEFWSNLKSKAGLAPDAWPENLRVHRYYTESFSEHSP